VDIQVICASHRDLATLVSEGRFREDLYFRLGCARFCLPPLRERSDKLALINRLLEQQAHTSAIRIGIGQAALELLLGYAWPGNVRQLRHVLAYACAVCEGDTIQLADLPVEVRGEQVEALAEPSVSPERQVVLDALIRHRWKPLPTAQALGISGRRCTAASTSWASTCPASTEDVGGLALHRTSAGRRGRHRSTATAR
jgi:transcriptional regulator of acetoin/glycerol metabolism